METFGNKHNGIPARLYALQGRINLEMQLTQKLGIFATGGYGIDKQYGKSRSIRQGIDCRSRHYTLLRSITSKEMDYG